MMNDLLKVLEQLLLNSDGIIAFPIQIKCILAAFRALRNQGYVVDIDVKVKKKKTYVYGMFFFIYLHIYLFVTFGKKKKKKVFHNAFVCVVIDDAQCIVE